MHAFLRPEAPARALRRPAPKASDWAGGRRKRRRTPKETADPWLAGRSVSRSGAKLNEFIFIIQVGRQSVILSIWRSTYFISSSKSCTLL